MRRVEVDLPGSSYAIYIDTDLLSQTGPAMRELGLGGAAVVVTHPEIPLNYRAAVVDSLMRAGFRAETAFVPQGEASKSLKVLGELYETLAAKALDRRSTIVALGGG